MARARKSKLGRWSGPVLILLGALSMVMAMVSPAAAAFSVSVSPSTGLKNGDSVNVSGSGFNAGLGVILECNSDPTQPTVGVSGNPVPVSCSSPFNALINFDATGSLAATPFAVHTGTIGPPGSGADSAGHDAAADAALWPCPPTPAQQTAGATCLIALADIAGHQATMPVSFGSATTTTTAGGTTTTTKAATTTTSGNATTSTTTGATTTTIQPTTTTISGATTTTAPSGPTVTLGSSVVSPGGQLGISGTGFPGNTDLQVVFASTPQVIATPKSSPSGTFSTTAPIPSNAEIGTHTITVRTTDGNVSKAVTIQVASTTTTAAVAGATTTLAASVLGAQTTNGTVAFTGSNAQRWATIGGICLLAGIILVLNARPIRPAKRRAR